MKFPNIFIIALILLSYNIIYSQEIIYITPQQLVKNMKNSNKATVIQFWVPNCDAAQEIITEYKKLEEQYYSKIDFYFLGLTNKKELVENLVKTNNYKGRIYIIDPSVNEDIIVRKEVFAQELCSLLDLKSKDFITMYLNRNDKKIYYGNNLDIKESKIKSALK